MLERLKVLTKFIQCQRTCSALVPTHFLCVYSFPRNSELSSGKVFSANTQPLGGNRSQEPVLGACERSHTLLSALDSSGWSLVCLAGHWQWLTALFPVSRNRFSSLKLSRQLIPPVLPVTLQSQKLVLRAEKARCLLKKFTVVLAQEVSMDIFGITKAINSLINVNKWLD